MKNMIYTDTRVLTVLHSGTYNGYEFVILSLGTHPSAYVNIGKDSIDEDKIATHGGITYVGSQVYGSDNKGQWIGWDYAHLGDYMGYYQDKEYSFGNKMWTTSEIFDHVKNVIEQVEKQNGLRKK